MAHTARSKADEAEYFDSPELLEKKVAKLAQLITDGKYFIAFTGAGISTSTGIPGNQNHPSAFVEPYVLHSLPAIRKHTVTCREGTLYGPHWPSS